MLVSGIQQNIQFIHTHIYVYVFHIIHIIPKKVNPKECSNYHTVALISHASKVMLKIVQARLQQHVNHELPDVQTGIRKGRGNRDQIANRDQIDDLLDHQKSKRVPENHLFLLY